MEVGKSASRQDCKKASVQKSVCHYTACQYCEQGLTVIVLVQIEKLITENTERVKTK